jgi:hypothetical protein
MNYACYNILQYSDEFRSSPRQATRDQKHNLGRVAIQSVHSDIHHISSRPWRKSSSQAESNDLLLDTDDDV